MASALFRDVTMTSVSAKMSKNCRQCEQDSINVCFYQDRWLAGTTAALMKNRKTSEVEMTIFNITY
jgi:hypothetical protein